MTVTQKNLIISVAMCTYNGEKYVRQQIESIINQRRPPNEIIICDDCSTDNTLNIIKDFEGLHGITKIKIVVNNRNIGYLKNFESAISMCSGDIVVLCDQDDLWEPKKLEIIEKYFIDNPHKLVVFSDGFIIDKDSRKKEKSLWEIMGLSKRDITKFKQNDGIKVLLKKDVITGATMAFRSQMKSYILPLDNHFVHDSWIAMLATLQGKLGIIDEKLISYRVHIDQQIGSGHKNIRKKIKEKHRFSREVYNLVVLKCEVLEHRLMNINYYDSLELNLLKEKKLHFKSRISLSKYFVIRFFQVLGQLISFKYTRYAGGIASACKDLFFLR
jgi:glycosyltransferase involved in cell wall biosynthesis